MKIISLLSGLFLINNISFAQTTGLVVEKISSEQGLQDKRVNCITQDNNGFIWVGTNNGLSRYDGYNFQEFTQQITGSKQIKGVKVSALEKDKNGRIWIGYNDGLAIMNPISGKAELINLTGYKGSNKMVKRIFFDNTGRILLFTEPDIVLCFTEKMILEFSYHFSIVNKLELLEHPIILQDADSSFWLPTFFNGIDHISKNGKFIEHYRQVMKPSKDNRLKTFTDSKGLHFEFYLGKPFTQVIQHKEGNAISPFIAMQRTFNSPAAFYDKMGNIWKIQMETITLQDTIAKKEMVFTLPYKGDFFTDYPFLNIFQSIDNTIWACSRKGIFKINYKRSPFKNYLDVHANAGQPGISIRGMSEDNNGDIWIGSYPFAVNNSTTRANLSLLKAGSLKAEPVLLTTENNRPFDVGGSPLHNIIAENENIIATSEGRYIRRINKYTKVVSNDSTFLLHQAPNTALIYRGNNIYFFTSGSSVGIYNPNEPNGHFFSDVYKNNRKELFKGVNNFFDAGNSLFWAVGNTGIYLMNNRGSIIRYFSSDKNSPVQLPALDINFLYRQKDGLLWLGTRHGMVRLDTLQKTSKLFTTEDGLPNNNVMSILQDEFGYLWLSTDNGLSRYNIMQNFFINYDINDDLPNNEFNRMAFLKTRDGRLLFGGLNGVTAVYPKEVDTLFNNLQPFLVGYTNYNGQQEAVVSVASFSMADKKIVFNHNDKLFNFRFMLPAYRNAAKNRFLYQLENWDKKWQMAVNSNIISYSFLPPGKYLLRVKGAAAGDSWSSNEYTLEIIILQAWYKTWWFYSCTTLFFAAIVFALYRYRIKQIDRVQNIRNKISADLHDELGSVLTQISLQSEMVSSNIYSEEEKMAGLQNISNTSRLAIHAMSDIVWSVKAGHDKTFNLIDRMKDHADLMLQPLNTNIDFKVSGINEQREIDNNLRQELFLIFKEAIHNIVKHGNSSHVQINLQNQNGYFEMIIKNDIRSTKENSVLGGNGLKNMQKRAAAIHASIVTIKDANSFTMHLKRNTI